MKRIIFFLLVLTAFYNSNAQNPEWVHYFSWENVCTFAEEDEFIWAGCDGGLIQINKKIDSITYYDIYNSGLPDFRVRCIEIDKQGNKWIGTKNGGLAKFDNENWTIFDTSNSGLLANNVTSLALDSTGSLLVGTEDKGLFKLEGNYLDTFEYDKAFKYCEISAIAIEKEGIIWIGTNRGDLYKYNNGKWDKKKSGAPDFPFYGITDIEIDKNNIKWFATSGSDWLHQYLFNISGSMGMGVFNYNDSTWIYFNTYNTTLFDDDIWDITFDKEGDLWVATLLFGIGELKDSNWINYNDRNSGLQYYDVSAIHADIDGNIWAGTFKKGISKFNGTLWKYYNTYPQGPPTNIITDIVFGKNGEKFVGTICGIGSFDGQIWKNYEMKDNNYSPYKWFGTETTAMAVDSNNEVWLGMGEYSQSALQQLNKNGTTTYSYDNKKFPSRTVNSIAFGDNQKWVGTDGEGLNGTFSADKVDFIAFTKFACDSSGNIWIGTENNGLFKYDGIKWESKDFNAVRQIYCDEKGILWILDNKKNIHFYNGTEWNSFTVATQYGHDRNTFEFDDDGNFWLGSDDGIIKCSKDFKVDTTYKKSLAEYPFLYAYDLDFDTLGNIWAGTAAGFVKYDGINWNVWNTLNSVLPSRHVTSLKIDTKNIVWIGTEYGLLRLTDTTLVLFDKTNSPIGRTKINSIYLDKYDNKWFSTSEGILKFDGINWELFNNTAGTSPFGSVNDIMIDKSSNLWAGSSGNGVIQFSDSSWEVHRMAKIGPMSNFINNLAVERNGDVWMSAAGLVKFDGSDWSYFNSKNSPIPLYSITAIALDRNENKWIGTVRGDILKYDNEIWTVYDEIHEIVPDTVITDIVIDSKDNKWIVAKGYGLIKFDNKNWTLFNKDNSILPDNYIMSLAVDPFDNIWIGTYGFGLLGFREGGVILSNEDEKQMISQKVQITCYPNPTTTNLNIQINNIEPGNISLKLFDIFGREVEMIYNGYTNGNLNLNHNIGYISSGTYFLVLTTKSGRTAERVVISN